MKKRAQELIEYGRLCGFAVAGNDGNEHWVMRHPNGSTVRVACTPGDYRGDDNTRAEMRRKSGVSPARPRAGRYRRGINLTAFVPADERIDSISHKYAQIEREHHEACERITYLQSLGSDHRGEVREVLAKLERLEASARDIGRRPPLRSFRVHYPMEQP